MASLPTLELPAGWKTVQRLSVRPDEEVWQVGRGDRLAALRLLAPDCAERWRAEIDALASYRGPGVARLLDFGRLPDGRLAIWREWVVGTPLGSWASGRPVRELAAVLVEVCVSLASLHEQGAVHGDLKAENVIVDHGGKPTLTDLGLGGGQRAGARSGGTLLALAPECLDGSPPTPGADLFAFGSLLHGLLAGRFPNPREFYARFPLEDYASAAGVPLDELPDWSRALAASLLERDPETRASSALACAADLAARAELEPPRARQDALRWSPLTGRSAWALVVRRSLRSGQVRSWRLPPGEDVRALCAALRVELVTVDEHFSELVVSGTETSPVLQLGDARTRLIGGGTQQAEDGLFEQALDLAAHTAESIAEELSPALAGDLEQVRALARHLARTAGGADGIDRELCRLQRRGALLPGPQGWRFEDRSGERREQVDLQQAALDRAQTRRLECFAAALRADPAHWVPVSTECRRLCDDGLPQRVLAWLADLREELGEGFPAALVAEEAVAWAQLGQSAKAENALSALSADGDDSLRAAAMRAEGRISASKHDYEAARSAFDRAAVLDPEDGGDALLQAVRLAFERGDAQELDALLVEAAHRQLDSRTSWNLNTMAAMACFRQGQIAEARGRLDAQVETALRDDMQEALAAALSNRATVERRAGRMELAVRDFEEAAEIYASIGSTPGCARIQQALGGTLRELGELDRAERALRSALETRERLGDERGALAVRGSLGLLLADRGHVRPALDELSASAEALAAGGRSLDAAWMRAAAAEVRARLELGEAFDSEDPDPDPRVFLCAARRARWSARTDFAREWAERALSLATRLSREANVEEARWELSRLGEEALSRSAWTSPRLQQDVDVVRWLETPHATLDGEAALACAGTLAGVGRDDRAAHLAGAIASRTRDAALSRRAAAFARECFDRAAQGLTAEEREVFAGRLMDGPDRNPGAAEVVLRGLPEDLIDMDALTLLEINHRMVEQQNLDELCKEIVRSALRMSGAERGFLILEEDGEWSFDTALNSRCGPIDKPEMEISRSILNKALESKQPVRSSNAVDDPAFEGAQSVTDLNLRSILCTPIHVDQSVRGVLYLDHRVEERVFDERAERLLCLLADQAALAIRQVRRLEEIGRLNGLLRKRVATRESELDTARRVLRESEVVLPASGLVGSSRPMLEVHRLLQLAARAPLPALITGESGTGKELAARALHSMGPQSAGPFVAENCAALPESLVEAELFGVKAGAFTGADRDRPGLFERADGGTLFLDEIGEIPLSLQAKLLRVLETSEVRRIGSDRLRTVQFRLVAATNRDLAAESAAGRFRADLMYRLDAMCIEMPSLAARVDDIPELIEHFLRLEFSRSGVERQIAPDVMAAFARRAWPGNVRELGNEVARLCVLSGGDLIDASLLREARSTSDAQISVLGTMEEIERSAIEAAVEECNGDKAAAAKRLGISRAKVYQRWKSWYGEGAQ